MWFAAWCNVALVLTGALIAYYVDQAFTKTQLGEKSIPYLYHGGMYADLLLLTPIAYYMCIYAPSWRIELVAISAVAALVITIAAHVNWARLQPIDGHLIFSEGAGTGELTVGGRYHVAYMAAIVMMVLQYYLFTPGIDPTNKLIVSGLLTVFIVPSIVLPTIYVAKMDTGRWDMDSTGIWTTIGMVVAIWAGYFAPIGDIVQQRFYGG